MGKYQVPKDHNLTLSDLKEKQIYVGTLTVDGVVQINHCLFKMIDNKLHIHRSANWEDVHPADTTDEAFMEDANFPWIDAPCFKLLT